MIALGSSARWRTAFVVLLGALVGCGGGGGGGGATGIVSNPATIADVTVTPSLSDTVISFVLSTPDSSPISVDVDYSENRGLTFKDATITPDAVTGLDSSPDGVPYSIAWSPTIDLISVDQSDLQIRLTPRDELTDLAGVAAYSAVFALGTNTPPVLVAVTTPVATVGGVVTFDVQVRDDQSDVVELDFEYSVNGGASWSPATPGVTGSNPDAVTTGLTPVTHTVSWFAQVDAPGTVSNAARFRLTPVDIESGLPVSTEAFAINLIAPELNLLTLGEVPGSMNGSTPYVDDDGGIITFELAVATSGIRLRTEYSSLPNAGAVLSETLSVIADGDLGSNAPAGTELGDFFVADGTGATWLIPSEYALPAGEITFTARIQDTYGNVSNAAELPLTATTPDGASRPFDVADVWWLDCTTDYFSISFTGGPTVSIQSAPAPNGIADYEEDMLILGLRSANPTPECVVLGTNAMLLAWAKAETLGRLRELFGGSFDGSVPGYSTQLSFTFAGGNHRSVIRVGGDDLVPGFTIGRAQFDYRNAVGNDNRASNLGIFTTNLISFYINSSFSFQSRFNDLIPGRGTPAGEDALDAIVLHPEFARLDPGNTLEQNARYDELYNAIDAWARSVAVILSHEIGHSIGLVANGSPPHGLFGGVRDAPFSGAFTTDFHLDTPGANLMASALSFSASLVVGSAAYRFNALNETYLKEWTLLK